MSARIMEDDPGCAPTGPTQLSIGHLQIELTETAVGSVLWKGVELLRGVSHPIRDSDWGSASIIVNHEQMDRRTDRVVLQRHFTAWGGAISGVFALEATAEGRMQMRLSLEVARRIAVCRAGFTVLHPIAGLAGNKLQVTHTDHRQEETIFPKLVSPRQPVRDISGLRYSIAGCSIALNFSGETFEMEDQRNWSDASYKTYCRPLSLPFPFELDAGTRINQTIEMVFDGSPTSTAVRSAAIAPSLATDPTGETMPSVALAVEPPWNAELPPGLRSIPRLVRLALDSSDRSVLDGLAAPFDLELVTSDDIAIAREQLQTLARWLHQAGLVPRHVVALPRAYLQSYQPDATWPSGATPSQLVAAARLAFPGARIGGGMLTNFTEFNRCRPDPAGVDYITHGSSAIVHAADTKSVFQTIEALPQIFASAREIATGLPYRLGLVSIGMRSNPYGEGLVENPTGALRTTTHNDPRARTRVGAAWTVAALAATSGAAIEQIAVGAPVGPFGIMEPGGSVAPSYHVVRALHAMAGKPRTDRYGSSSIVSVSAREHGAVRAVVANLAEDDIEIALGEGAIAAVLDATTEQAATDHGWLDHACAPHSNPLHLAPHAIAFVTLPTPGAAA